MRKFLSGAAIRIDLTSPALPPTADGVSALGGRPNFAPRRLGTRTALACAGGDEIALELRQPDRARTPPARRAPPSQPPVWCRASSWNETSAHHLAESNFRHRTAPHGFAGAYEPNRILGLNVQCFTRGTAKHRYDCVVLD